MIAFLWIIARLTNTLQFFSSPTITNYPTIKNGDRFFASNLIKPKRFDFICYHAELPFLGKQILTHRLCGLEGDKIEIKASKLYINDQSVDNHLSLAHNYILPASEFSRLKQMQELDEELINTLSKDTFVTYVSDKTIKDHSIKAIQQILSATYTDDNISSKYGGASWNQDNFGPVVVPVGKYFVLGDNRLYSQDSRYQGFIDKSQFIATIIGRK